MTPGGCPVTASGLAASEAVDDGPPGLEAGAEPPAEDDFRGRSLAGQKWRFWQTFLFCFPG
jgi:hypothetical protein